MIKEMIAEPVDPQDTVALEDSERQECEIWTRVMGYHRPKNWFNRGKISEFNERKNFTEEKILAHLEEDCNEKK